MGGKAKVLPDGHPRRMPDAKNAWRKMSNAQRIEFLAWIMRESGTQRGMSPGVWLVDAQFSMIDHMTKTGDPRKGAA